MNKILTDDARIDLLKRHKQERDKRVADRIKVVLWVDEGWTFPQIAKLLFLDESTVREHFNIYNQENRLTPNHKGSNPILTPQESEKLTDHCISVTYLKIKDIKAYITTQYNKHLGVSTLHMWLQDHGFCYKKPKIVPKGVDKAKQEAFKAIYNKIMSEAAIEGEPVLFGDSVHPSQQVRAGYGWIRRGCDKLLESTGARKRVNIMGALNLATMGFVYQDFDTINGSAAVKFLKYIELAYPKERQIHLIWDQAGYHKCQEVKDFLTSSRIKVYYLPPRSPNLNPIERLWKVMHEYVSNNKTYDKFRDFKSSLFNFFDNTMPNIKEVLINRITDNFQTLP